MSEWEKRLLCNAVMFAVVLGLMTIGFSQEISRKDALEIYNSTSSYTRKLVVQGNVEETAFNMLVDLAPVVIACNAPLIGPPTAAAVSYYAGYSVKAEYVVGGAGNLAEAILEPASVLQVVALALAGGEGLFLSYKVWRREKAEFVDTAAVVLLELSLVALSVAIEAVIALR